jgi:ketosteroid isomerase-like protein
MTPDERSVLTANDAFYAAFRAQDLVAMDILWSRDARVLCVHPGWEPLEGRELVMRSWRAIFENGVPEVRLSDVRVSVFGAVACVVCLEVISESESAHEGAMAATNVFVREDGGWRMVHHHAGPVARDDDDDLAADDEPALLN